MPTLFCFNGFKLAIYFNDHGIPHVHLIGAECDASIAIETGEVIVGDSPADALAAAREFIVANRETLLATWRKE